MQIILSQKQNILSQLKKVSASILAQIQIQKLQKLNKSTQFAIGLLGLYAVNAILKNYGLLPKKNISNQHVFITGAGQGIGRKMAIQFAKLNCNLSLVDLNYDNLLKLEADLKQINSQIKVFIAKCDVSDYEKVYEIANLAKQKNGKVDILINNAGIVSGKKILQNSEKAIQKTIEVNTISHHWTVRTFLPDMIKDNKGHIVTIASVAGTVGVCGLVDYCASKFGAFGFDESLRMELRNLNSKVRTTCICPYYIDTGMFKGVKSRFSFLLPIMKEDYVVKRIVNAVLQNEQVVLIPWVCNLSVFFRGILPVSVFDSIMDIIGANKSMESFIGHS